MYLTAALWQEPGPIIGWHKLLEYSLTGMENKMAEPKTKANDMPVADFIDALQDTQVRQDCWTIVGIMQAAAQASPRMWGTAIIGFGQYPR